MSPALTFFAGLVLLIIFGWYFATDSASRKRWLGLVLSVLLVAFCLEEAIPPSKKIPLGLDLQGGTSFLIRLTPQDDQVITADLLDQAVEVIRRRVDAYGVSEPVITPQGNQRILVQIPGLDTNAIERTKAELQRVAKLEFATVAGGEDRIARIEAGEEIMPPGFVIKTYKDKVEGKDVEFKLLVKRRAELSGEHVKRAYAYFDQQGYGVSLSLDAEGAKVFGDLTQSLAPTRGQIAILLDGEVQSAPRVNEPIYGGNAVITGRFSDKEARDLASALENPLRVPVEIEETRSASPTLGVDSIRSGVLAGLTGIVLVLAFVMVYYRFAGIVAFVGLLVNIIILFGAMAMFHFVLTLPGIAGIILTIGMAIDANVLIYERLREETAAGKSLSTAIEAAYDKAFSAIFDANVTTLITAVILFWQATGSVKGFAVTLTLGIIASMFSALIVTRTAFRWMIERFGLKKLSMLDLIPKRKFNFLGKRWMAAILSLAMIGGSLVIFLIRGEKNFGIDFRGGDLLVVDSKQPLTVSEARTALEKIGLADVIIQFEREGMQDRLSVRSPQGTSATILAELQETFPDREITALAQENVGPQIGREFAKRAVVALGLGMIGILLYVTLRFEFSFALGAVVALLHDVIITLGIFSLIGGELSLVMVGAILTIAGYSINDTIVVFDRIREGLKQREGGSIQALMNNSINETLGRTILTGGTTLLSVGALFFFGGAVLRDFSFAILVGILIGTYSSIFIAAPIVLWWSRLRGKSVRREVLEAEAINRA
jgi:SecD/SecF fusion protein